MRKKPSLLFCAWATVNCALAQFTGLDDFSGAGKNTAKWGADIKVGSGILSQSGDGVLRYSLVGENTDNDYTEWIWGGGHAPFSSSWSIQADVHVPIIELPPGYSAAGMGLGVWHSADSTDSFGVNLENVRSEAAQEYNFYNRLGINGTTTETSVASSSTRAAVRIRWDASTHTLAAQYDVDGATGGYQWTTFQTFDPVASSTWNMSSSSTFGIFIRGYSEETEVRLSHDFYVDNFYVMDDSLPSLSIVRRGDQLSITWPRLALGYVLESSSSVAGIWEVASNPVTVLGDQNSVTIEPSGSKMFFRLRK